MPKTIRAVFEHGVFRPTEPVSLPDGTEVDVLTPEAQAAPPAGPLDLPDPCEVEVEVRAVAAGEAPPSPHPGAAWDEIFASKLVINSAPPDQHGDDEEATGDDFLF